MAATKCTDCGRRVHTTSGIQMCEPCEEYAGWENTHSDGAHDKINEGKTAMRYWNFKNREDRDAYLADERKTMEHCPVCHPELDPRKPVKGGNTTGHHSPRRTQLNHRTQCTHAQTPAARRVCREAYWAGVALQEKA